jgi:queuosine precursor transporter
MKKTNNVSFLQLVLTLVFVVSLLISNVITSKQVLLPFGIVMTGAVFIFPITYILSDVFSEVYGYRWSRITCYMGFAANLFMVIVFSLVIVTPAPSFWTHQEAFQTVLGNTPRILIASLLAFVIGDFVNDRVFKRMKEKYPSSHKGFGWRAIISSFAGEIIDSLVFSPIAFLGQMPVNNLVVMLVMHVLIKTGYEIVILPITYKVVHIVSKYEKGQPTEPKTIYSYDNKKIQK